MPLCNILNNVYFVHREYCVLPQLQMHMLLSPIPFLVSQSSGVVLQLVSQVLEAEKLSELKGRDLE